MRSLRTLFLQKGKRLQLFFIYSRSRGAALAGGNGSFNEWGWGVNVSGVVTERKERILGGNAGVGL